MERGNFKTVMTVVKETPNSLIVMCDDGPVFDNRTTRLGTITMNELIRVAKKHLLPGSDHLGIPNERDKEDTRVTKGVAVLPQWVATRHGLWKRTPEEPESTE